MSYFRPNIDAMTGYVPGEQPQGATRVIKLNTNENPYPPSSSAMDAMRAVEPDALRRYSDPVASAVREAVSAALSVPADHVLVGNGSDDLLTMLFRACTGPDRSAGYPMPTYTLYRTLAAIQAAPTVEVPWREGFSLPIEELAQAGCALTLIANPNSPTGTFVPIAQLAALADRLAGRGVVVIDEAYADFARDNAVRLVNAHENVIVLRTLSKGYGLAGLRLGFGLAQPALLAGLMKVKDSYNVDAVSCRVGAAAIADQAWRDETAGRVIASRASLGEALSAMGFSFPASESNFLLVTPPKGVSAEGLYTRLKSEGILVRYFQQPDLADTLRITVGTDEENRALVDALARHRNDAVEETTP